MEDVDVHGIGLEHLDDVSSLCCWLAVPQWSVQLLLQLMMRLTTD